MGNWVEGKGWGESVPVWATKGTLPTRVCTPSRALPRRSEVEARAGLIKGQDHQQSEEPMLEGWWPGMGTHCLVMEMDTVR